MTVNDPDSGILNERSSPVTGSGGRVLVVDDSPMNCDMIAELLAPRRRSMRFSQRPAAQKVNRKTDAGTVNR